MDISWSALFAPNAHPVEMFIRGTAMYWFIFLVLRIAGRRDMGSLGVADLVVIVLVADAAGSAMSGEDTSLTSAMIVVATIVFWSVAVDRVAYFFPGTRKWLSADKVLLVRDGRMVRRGMRQEYITEEELFAELRLNGVEELSQVHRAYIESDGHISVVRRRRTG